jgi:O-antigen ligase
VLLAMLVYFIVLTEARSALIVMAAFLLFGTWLVFRGKTYRSLPLWLLILAAVFPLIFAGLYLSFVHSDWINQTFSFLVNEGKALTNRVEIWQNAFRAFADSPILGAYSQLSHGKGTFQMHNTHVDILASYGISVLIGVCVLLYRSMKAKNTRITRQTSSLFLAAFIGALSLGIGEAALFSGGIGIYLFVCEFLLLANPLSGEDSDEARISE